MAFFKAVFCKIWHCIKFVCVQTTTLRKYWFLTILHLTTIYLQRWQARIYPTEHLDYFALNYDIFTAMASTYIPNGTQS
jgi:hypothetical protein